METGITVRAPAKINVSLEVIGKLPNGYHRIRSVLVRLDKLFDTIDIRIGAGANGITLSSNADDLPIDERNSCHQAAHRYLDAIGESVGVHIHIRKAIPIAAGLGGGSSDAAAVLGALNKHFRRALSQPALHAMAADVGKDVPFFLSGFNTAYVWEAGDKMRALPLFPPAHFLIINPAVGVSTADAYRSFSQSVWFMARQERADISRRMRRAIESNDLAKVTATLYNDFELIVERVHPLIKELKQALIAFGAMGTLMSGSGPTVFGLFRSKKALLNADEILRAHYPRFVINMA